ncbi:hypothetical protein BDQ12DRAFT_630303 [Crucibulum laeve]|uniref:Late embryogenesis abundant protein LEA-2 subgroup domain-containing protein n=1 Tax=Crucibulum laeve TaxID=68775 RepID=A0A5C3M109_9AGAR|nr:hypothetical protein BDQ12DRAFT_630303 [Crucibulum laeve]
MDSDRKSTVSSFYGARKTSLDALNSDFSQLPPGAASVRPRERDDSSSFFNPDRQSMDALNGGRTTPGYNRNSFFPGAREEPLKGGRDEEEQTDAWDVYADFNNAGPKYSTAFTQNNQGYHQLAPSTPKGDDASTTGPVEMVTVPALGAEWKREELHDMTKGARKQKKAESRREFWKQWNRGERGLCGRYFTRKVFVFFLFGLCVAIALVLAFTIPRVPSFAFNDKLPISNATGDWKDAVPTVFSRIPANFSFPASASIQVNTNDNYLPITFKHIRAQVFDLETSRLVGTGDMGKQTLPAKSFPEIMIPLNFTYIASNDTDQTWLNWYNSCKNKILVQDGKRDALQFRLVLDFDILGLTTTHSASTQISDAACPIELPSTI